MRFRVIFYRKAASSDEERDTAPMTEFLNELRLHQPVLEKLLVAALEKLATSARHGFPLTRPITSVDGLFELRVGHADIARAFFFYASDRRIIVTHGYVKKQKKTSTNQIQQARRYMCDWRERFP